MTFAENTGKTIKEAFDEFHSNNPETYGHFKRLALLAINKGRRKISFRVIMDVIRWEIFLETDDDIEIKLVGEKRKFKINDAYCTHYARAFVQEFPQHADKIEFRALRADDGKKQKELF